MKKIKYICIFTICLSMLTGCQQTADTTKDGTLAGLGGITSGGNNSAAADSGTADSGTANSDAVSSDAENTGTGNSDAAGSVLEAGEWIKPGEITITAAATGTMTVPEAGMTEGIAFEYRAEDTLSMGPDGTYYLNDKHYVMLDQEKQTRECEQYYLSDGSYYTRVDDIWTEDETPLPQAALSDAVTGRSKAEQKDLFQDFVGTFGNMGEYIQTQDAPLIMEQTENTCTITCSELSGITMEKEYGAYELTSIQVEITTDGGGEKDLGTLPEEAQMGAQKTAMQAVYDAFKPAEEQLVKTEDKAYLIKKHTLVKVNPLEGVELSQGDEYGVSFKKTCDNYDFTYTVSDQTVYSRDEIMDEIQGETKTIMVDDVHEFIYRLGEVGPDTYMKEENAIEGRIAILLKNNEVLMISIKAKGTADTATLQKAVTEDTIKQMISSITIYD